MELKKIAEEMQPKTMAARDWVFQVIRMAIVRGILPGGMPLRQDEISSALNVSHIPVREAFRQLEAQGLVRIYPNRGAVVTRLTRHELEYDTLNLQFHLALYAPCNNDVALSMIDQLHANSDRYLRPYYPKEDDSAFKSIEEHQALIDACHSKDAELACAVLRTHLESTKTLLLGSSLLN